MARNRFAILELTKKLRDRGRFRQSGILQKQLCLWAHEAQNAASSTQLRSVPRKKRGGFVGSGPPKPPFAPMRGVGEGEKIYIFMKPLATTPSIVCRLQNFPSTVRFISAGEMPIPFGSHRFLQTLMK